MDEGVSRVKEVENWLSPAEAGRLLGTSGQWVTQLARTGRLGGVRTSLGWLVNPADVDRLANERMQRAETKLSAMRSARSARGNSSSSQTRGPKRETSTMGGEISG